MNNEPVAWISENGRIFDELPPISDGLMPLYAHPAKTLTDEEIDSLIIDVAEKPTDEDLYDFAKAILKKVQE
jgi:hypothetical protein